MHAAESALIDIETLQREHAGRPSGWYGSRLPYPQPQRAFTDYGLTPSWGKELTELNEALKKETDSANERFGSGPGGLLSEEKIGEERVEDSQLTELDELKLRLEAARQRLRTPLGLSGADQSL